VKQSVDILVMIPVQETCWIYNLFSSHNGNRITDAKILAFVFLFLPRQCFVWL